VIPFVFCIFGRHRFAQFEQSVQAMTLRPERIDFEQTWDRLKTTLESVIKVRTVTRNEWTERFTDVYKMCVAVPDPLCDKLYIETKAFIEEHVKQMHTEVRKASSDQLLKVYYEHWINYKRGIDYLNNLYSYLNIQYIKKQKFSEADMFYGCVEINEQKLEIRELGLFFWEENMIRPLKEQLTRLLLDAIKE
jgi:cullin 2